MSRASLWSARQYYCAGFIFLKIYMLPRWQSGALVALAAHEVRALLAVLVHLVAAPPVVVAGGAGPAPALACLAVGVAEQRGELVRELPRDQRLVQRLMCPELVFGAQPAELVACAAAALSFFERRRKESGCTYR